MMKKILLNVFLVSVVLLSLFKTDSTVSAAGEGACLADKTGLTEFDNLQNTDLIARLIFAEARGESMTGKRAVARITVNRSLHEKAESEFGGTTPKRVILNTVGGFVGMKKLDARCPDLTSQEWKDSLQAANDFWDYPNPIGNCLWFNTVDVFAELSRPSSSGGYEYRFPDKSYYQKLIETKTIGKHTFFRVSGY